MVETQKKIRAVLAPYLIDDPVELSEEISRGAYSSVVKVRWQGVEYAGKKLHNLTIRLEKKKEEVLARMKTTCELLTTLHHPNLVQFFGVSFSRGDQWQSPILLTELFPYSVASALEHHTRFPLSVQLSILRDISQALVFLHCRQKPIVHSNITANNVLLSRGLQAKLSDLGVARLVDPSTGKMTVAMTKTAAAAAYSPPEDKNNSHHDYPSFDIFSFGVLALHTATGKWPIPTPGEGSEIDRRREYISTLRNEHCLMPVIRDCLNNDPQARPVTFSILERLSHVATGHPLPYESALELMIKMERREGELMAMVNQLEAGRKEVEGFDKRISNYDDQLHAVKEQMKSMEEQLSTGLKDGKPNASMLNAIFQPVRTTRKELKPEDAQVSTSMPLLKPTQNVFQWKQASPAPVGMHSASGVVLEGKLYIGGGITKGLDTDMIVYECDITGLVHKWTPLPVCPVAYCGLGVINKSLVLIGGVSIATRKTTNKLYHWDKENQEWNNSLPPMPTPREHPAAMSHNLSLIVAGGYSNRRALAKVEKFDEATFSWQTLPDLPMACSGATCCVVRDTLYVLGGSQYEELGAQAVVQTLPLTRDISQATWTMVKEAPLTLTAAVPSNNFLITVGGSCMGSSTPNKAIYVYLPEVDRWVFLCEMPTAHSKCVAAVLSAGRLIVIGGKEEGNKPIHFGVTVEVLSV